jgi:hypothetical protein
MSLGQGDWGDRAEFSSASTFRHANGDKFSHSRAAVTNKPGDLLNRHPGIRQHGHERVPQLASRPLGRIDTWDQCQRTAEVSPDVPSGHLGSDGCREHEPRLLPRLTGSQPIGQVPRSLVPQRLDTATRDAPTSGVTSASWCQYLRERTARPRRVAVSAARHRSVLQGVDSFKVALRTVTTKVEHEKDGLRWFVERVIEHHRGSRAA